MSRKINPDKLTAFRLARQAGATIEATRHRSTYQVDIYLPEGSAWDGNEGLDALHHEVELEHEASIWADVVRDLEIALGL